MSTRRDRSEADNTRDGRGKPRDGRDGARDAGPHVGELAELHALGALDPLERAEVETHVADCASCARALGTAEAAVAALTDAFVPRLEPPERLGLRIVASGQALVPRRASRRPALPVPGLYAAAAAVLLAVGIGGGALVEHSADVRQAAHESTILATIATSHFNHVSLTARAPDAPVSKVLYARDGAWLYLIIDSATCDCRVVVHSGTLERDLGKPQVRANTATLFVNDLAHPTALDLIDASDRLISTAKLIYSAPPRL